MPPAARMTDPTTHGIPLNPGPGSPNVVIGFMPAWRALPSSVGGAVDSISNSMNSFMTKPQLTPPSAVADLAQISANLVQGGVQAAAAGPAGASVPATAASQVGTLNASNVALTATWTAASAVPGGQPAANAAYTEGVKGLAAVAASATMSAMAGMADMHMCPLPVPVPPHGPGFVTKGSSSVLINNLPAARQNDQVMEACGGSDPILMGCPTVEIGDSGGSGGGGGGGAGAGSSASSSASPADEAVRQSVASALADGSTITLAHVTATQAGPLEPEEEQAPEPSWLGVRLKEFDETPVAGQDVTVTLDDGQVVSGTTDEEGYVRFEGVPPGSGEAAFGGIPEHCDAVQQQEETPGEEERQAAQRTSAPGERPEAAPAGNEPREVDGEYLLLPEEDDE